MPKKARLIVTSSGKRALKELKADLDRAGFEVDESLDDIGVIVGRATGDAVQKLREIDGVSDVTEEGEVNIGPPDSDNPS
jgi:hypothetical protein